MKLKDLTVEIVNDVCLGDNSSAHVVKRMHRKLKEEKGLVGCAELFNDWVQFHFVKAFKVDKKTSLDKFCGKRIVSVGEVTRVYKNSCSVENAIKRGNLKRMLLEIDVVDFDLLSYLMSEEDNEYSK